MRYFNNFKISRDLFDKLYFQISLFNLHNIIINILSIYTPRNIKIIERNKITPFLDPINTNNRFQQSNRNNFPQKVSKTSLETSSR